MPAGARQVGAGTVSLLTYPLQQLDAFRERDKKKFYGVRLRVRVPSLLCESTSYCVGMHFFWWMCLHTG
jgi:hypothetical protein